MTNTNVVTDACECNADFYGDDTSLCTTCPTYSTSDPGSSVCTCAANYHYVAGTMTCQDCPAGYTSEIGSTDASDCNAPPSSSSTSPLSGGAIIGITIAVIVGVAASVAVIVYYDKMARDKRRFMIEVDATSASSSSPIQQKNVV